MKIKFRAIHQPENWLKMVATQLDRTVTNGEVRVPPKYGEGILKDFYPMKWLTISYLNFRMNEPFEMERTAVKDSPYIPVMFYFDTPGKQILDNSEHKNTTEGIFMPSAQIESKWVLPAGKWITNLTLTFDKTWLLQQLGNDNYICDLLNSKKSFYLFESLTPTILEQIQTIENYIMAGDDMKKLYMYGEAMKLFALFIDAVNSRRKDEAICGIHAADVQQVFRVRKILLNDVCHPPHIKDLAMEAGMSPTKLQKCFKQIFGKNIIQYALEQKMELSRELLESRRYSVSEVGYQLGYSNLSHFSKAFYKHFNITPKNFQASV